MSEQERARVVEGVAKEISREWGEAFWTAKDQVYPAFMHLLTSRMVEQRQFVRRAS